MRVYFCFFLYFLNSGRQKKSFHAASTFAMFVVSKNSFTPVFAFWHISKSELLKGIQIQGPPYILARHEIAIFSKSAGNFQKLFFTKQGCGYNDCLNKKIFLSDSIISYFFFKSYRFQKVIYWKEFDTNNSQLMAMC